MGRRIAEPTFGFSPRISDSPLIAFRQPFFHVSSIQTSIERFESPITPPLSDCYRESHRVTNDVSNCHRSVGVGKRWKDYTPVAVECGWRYPEFPNRPVTVPALRTASLSATGLSAFKIRYCVFSARWQNDTVVWERLGVFKSTDEPKLSWERRSVPPSQLQCCSSCFVRIITSG